MNTVEYERIMDAIMDLFRVLGNLGVEIPKANRDEARANMLSDTDVTEIVAYNTVRRVAKDLQSKNFIAAVSELSAYMQLERAYAILTAMLTFKKGEDDAEHRRGSDNIPAG